ncbi:MAG: TonB-dependent receptor plug domain-containing protein [Planctomycetaceae bacterium]
MVKVFLLLAAIIAGGCWHQGDRLSAQETAPNQSTPGKAAPAQETPATDKPQSPPSEDEAARELQQLQQLLTRPVEVPALQQVVTTVSRQESTLGKSPAAVFVITQEDIRRSGFRSIPEILRTAPGVNVARLESNTWGVSVRGFNDEFANKLLVLVDGREVYSPAFGGVHWDIVDTMIEDIERIEVIRGPGGTIWGNNAVNGVINIITKRAKDTQGGLATGGGGTEERAFGSVRHGGQVDANTHYRYYAKGFGRDESSFSANPNDNWRQGRMGFRLDSLQNADSYTVQGDIYAGTHGDFQSSLPPVSMPDRDHVYGGHLLARMTHTIADDTDWRLQVFYDSQNRQLENVGNPFVRRQGLFDLDFQYRFPLTEDQQIICGAGYRFSHDKFNTTPDLIAPALTFDPDNQIYSTYSLFAQDEIELLEDQLFFTIGSKFSWNAFSNFEIQPNARLSWMPDPRFMGWASVSRAVRIPTRADDALSASIGPLPISLPNRGLGSEEVIAYELGWRLAPTDDVFFDFALFYNEYDDLRTSEFFAPPAARIRGDNLFAETYGFEVASTLQLTDWWSMKVAYTLLDIEAHLKPGSTDSSTPIRIASEQAAEGGSPQNQVYARSSWNLSSDWQVDLGLRYVDQLPVVNVPHYLVGDARVAWRPRKNLELSVAGQNLFDNSHPEFGGMIVRSSAITQVERSVYGMVEYRY